jgi:hypothetical protein
LAREQVGNKGWGLVTRFAIPAGARIGDDYPGVITDMDELAAKKERFKKTAAGKALKAKLGPKTTEYLMEVPVEHNDDLNVLDPTDNHFNLSMGGVASIAYINEPRLGTSANAKYEFITTGTGTIGVGVFALRHIQAGEEISVNYGDSYNRSYTRI